jgi:hypothetical protein
MQPATVSHKANFSSNERIWWMRTAAATTVVVLLSLAAPLIWTAVSAGMGLLALAAIACVGAASMAALPLGMQRLENRMLQLRKAEARRNPIEQLQNEVIRRGERLVAFRKALVAVGAQIESIKQMVEDTQSKYSSQGLEMQQRALQRLEQFHSINIGRLNQAQSALQDFKSTVEQKQSQWEIALAIDDANRAMDPHAGENLIQGLLADTALREVQNRFNSVFAELDVQMSSMEAPTRDLISRSNADRFDALTLPRSINHR